MDTKYEYNSLDIQGFTVADAIAALQAWETENPEAINSCVQLYSDGDDVHLELSWQVPLTPEEIELKKEQKARSLAIIEQNERQTYERLKAKYGETESAD
jgi:hypothetical protein